MQLAPDTALFGAVFPDLPLAFPKYLEARRIDSQVGDTPFLWLPIGPAGPLAPSYSPTRITAHSSTRTRNRVAPESLAG